MDEELKSILTEAVRDADLHSADIPSIDLYLDQIISIVTDSLKNGSDRYADKILTKTMINNYSKDGLILPVKGKKYTKEQILQMLLVYTLKNTLSMNEIKRVLSFTYMKELPLTPCYDRYIDFKNDDRRAAVSTIENVIGDHAYDMERDEDYFSALLEVCTLSAYFRSMAQAMIDAKYPDPDEAEKERIRLEKEEEHHRREAEKAEKVARAAQKNQERAQKEAEAAEAALAALGESKGSARKNAKGGDGSISEGSAV